MHSPAHKTLIPAIVLSLSAVPALYSAERIPADNSETSTAALAAKIGSVNFETSPGQLQLAQLQLLEHGKIKLPVKVITKQSALEVEQIIRELTKQAVEFHQALVDGAEAKITEALLTKQVTYIENGLAKQGVKIQDVVGTELEGYSKRAKQISTIVNGTSALFAVNGALLFEAHLILDAATGVFVIDSNRFADGLYQIEQYGLPGYPISETAKRIPVAIVKKIGAKPLTEDNVGLIGIGSFAIANIPALSSTAIIQTAEFYYTNLRSYIHNFKALDGLTELEALERASENPKQFCGEGKDFAARVKDGGFAFDRVISRIIHRGSAEDSPTDKLVDAISVTFVTHEIQHVLDSHEDGAQATIDIAPGTSRIISAEKAKAAETLKELSVRIEDYRYGPAYRIADLIGQGRAGFPEASEPNPQGGGISASKEIFTALIAELRTHPADYGVAVRESGVKIGSIELSPHEQVLAQMAVLATPQLAELAASRITKTLQISTRKDRLASEISFTKE